MKLTLSFLQSCERVDFHWCPACWVSMISSYLWMTATFVFFTCFPGCWNYLFYNHSRHVFSLKETFIGLVFKIKSQVSALKGALYHRNDSHGRFSKILCQHSRWSNAHVSDDNMPWCARFQRSHIADLRNASGNATCHYAMPARFQDGKLDKDWLTHPATDISPIMSLIASI